MDSDFVKRIAIKTAIEKDVVEKVIEHSMRSIVKHSKECMSIEMTGFGNFYFREYMVPYYIEKFEKKIEKLKVHLNSLTREDAILRLRKRIEGASQELIELKKRYGME